MKIIITVKDTDNIIGLKEDISMRLEGVADILRIDTADVAPKSEVSREIFAEMLEKLNHIVITADVDVEYKTFMKTINQVCSAVSAELAELKKKYTEENDG